MNSVQQQLVDVLRQIEIEKTQSKVAFTAGMLADFMQKLTAMDAECRAIEESYGREIAEWEAKEKKEWGDLRSRLDTRVRAISEKKKTIIDGSKRRIDNRISQDITAKEEAFLRLHQCKGLLSLIVSVERSITSRTEYANIARLQAVPSSMTVEEILASPRSFILLAHEVNIAIRDGRKKEVAGKGAKLYGMCRNAEKLLNEEIARIRSSIIANRNELHGAYDRVDNELQGLMEEEWDSFGATMDSMAEEFALRIADEKEETLRKKCELLQKKKDLLEKKTQDFRKAFPPDALVAEYARIYANEPSYDHYECVKDMPGSIYISTFEYEVASLGLSSFSTEFLRKHYFFMLKDTKLVVPYCARFNSDFNYIFNFKGEERERVVLDACDMGMRLFMMLPPGKVKFTFIDPVTLGESFAMFMRLVDVDDRSSEIVNGKIWSTPSDIEERLTTMTNHISNVTQRCLQGKYQSIFDYNKVAKQNAEAYQIIMVMDYPASLNEQSLKLLEQISTSGPKCGVFTVIYRNENQFNKTPDRIRPLINNIETNFRTLNYSENGQRISYAKSVIQNRHLRWRGIRMPNEGQMNAIINTIKKGIKTADKIIIGIDELDQSEVTTSTAQGFRIPIGKYGGNEVQYLTLGVGGSHHALIAGVAGSGKSSLLHTIILRTLAQYSPDELSVYLVDFKRGVEFKIYADYMLPSFRVIAIESEREFGYNILMALEREQKIRADLFKKNHVDKIEEYRALGKKMPRILVIMDEFHELFVSSGDEIGKKSAVIMERIVKQGRAFGVHLILSSQSYSNISGISKSIFDQMAVRIVLKCSKTDANLLLENGSTEIDQISIDDPGRAVYNSEAGSKEYHNHFKVAYAEPEEHRERLRRISEATKKYIDPQRPTRILLSNIEDNNYSIFSQFRNETPETYRYPNRLYVGEPLSVSNSMALDFSRSEYSNLLMIGEDTEKARSMFAFSVLSLCINYWIKHQRTPDQPFIYLFNCKPLDDSYFKDATRLLADLLPEYIRYFGCEDTSEIGNAVSHLYDLVADDSTILDVDHYFFVFGYQRADELKSEAKLSQVDDMDSYFNVMPATSSRAPSSLKDMFRTIIRTGSSKGVHTVLWQDSFNSFYQNQEDKDIMAFFFMKIAFDMSAEEFSRFVGANDVSLLSENNAIYSNRARDNQNFRPYQSPDEDWLTTISEQLR